MRRIEITFPAGSSREVDQLCADLFHDHGFGACVKMYYEIAYRQDEQKKPLEEVFTPERIASLRAKGCKVEVVE